MLHVRYSSYRCHTKRSTVPELATTLIDYTLLAKVEKIQRLMQTVKLRMRSELPNIYSQDLLNNLFRHPYKKIEFLEPDLGKARPTATKYLERLVEAGFVRKTKSGKSYYFINDPLMDILSS